MYVCGQKNIINRIDSLVQRDKFPRFCILVAPEGYGKKVLSEYIAKSLGCLFVPCETKVESVRETIYNAYNVSSKVLYMFFDCDDMSVNSKNALLKVTEEPPNNAYFIMTVQNLSNVLPTIISRGTVFNLENYSISELKEYASENKYDIDKNTENVLYQVCTCPKDVTTYTSTDLKAVYDLADKFIQYIGSVSLYNEFKMACSLNMKSDADKIDPVLFMRCVMFVCNNYIKNECTKEDCIIFYKIIQQTSKYLSELCQKGSSKQMVIDNWILNTHLEISGGAL